MGIIELTKYLTTSRKWKCYKSTFNDESKQKVIKSLDWLNDSIDDDEKNINRGRIIQPQVKNIYIEEQKASTCFRNELFKRTCKTERTLKR